MGNLTQVRHVLPPMSSQPFSPRDRAAHYRELAVLMGDERTHRVLLEMAEEAEAAARIGEAHGPLPRAFS